MGKKEHLDGNRTTWGTQIKMMLLWEIDLADREELIPIFGNVLLRAKQRVAFFSTMLGMETSNWEK